MSCSSPSAVTMCEYFGTSESCTAQPEQIFTEAASISRIFIHIFAKFKFLVQSTALLESSSFMVVFFFNVREKSEVNLPFSEMSEEHKPTKNISAYRNKIQIQRLMQFSTIIGNFSSCEQS